MKLIVTKKGAALPHNSWKQGQEIDCGDVVGQHFIDMGFCVNPGEADPNQDMPELNDDTIVILELMAKKHEGKKRGEEVEMTAGEAKPLIEKGIYKFLKTK